MFFCRMRYFALPSSSLVRVATGMPSSGDRSSGGAGHADLGADPVDGLDVLPYGRLVDGHGAALDARGEDRAVAVGDRAAQGRQRRWSRCATDWASLETAEASNPCNRNSCAPKMLKMNSTAMVMVRIRRRGLDPSRLTLRRTGGRGGVAGRFGTRATGFAAARLAPAWSAWSSSWLGGLVGLVGLGRSVVARGWSGLGVRRRRCAWTRPRTARLRGRSGARGSGAAASGLRHWLPRVLSWGGSAGGRAGLAGSRRW